MASHTAYTAARDRIERACRAGLDSRSLRFDALGAIRRAVGFDAYAWLLTDPKTSVGSAPVADVPCMPELPNLIRLKYLTVVNRWTTLTPDVASLLAATNGDRSQSLMWRELLERYDIGDIASAVFRDRFGCWGFLDLWRAGPHAFTADELGFLSVLTAPLTAGLRQSQATTFAPTEDRAPGLGGPVVLLMSPTLQVRAQTAVALDYLRLLVPPDGGQQDPVPAGAYNVGAQLLAAEAGIDTNLALARVHLSAGRWLTMRAARLGAAPSADDGDIAVTIEATSPEDRCSLFSLAFGLSPRETDLLRHLATGADTRDVAGRMFVSDNTVQDHLKSVFAKTATRNRRALLARALGT